MTATLVSKVFRPGTASAGCLILVAALLPSPAESGDRGASVSRQSAEVQATGNTSSVSATPTASRSTSSSSGGAAVTRSNYGKSHSGGGRHYRRAPRSSRNLYFGLGYWWGYWHPYYHYPVFPTVYYGPSPGRYGSWRLGAVDLNIRPKKAEVWVDGQLVGRSGKFDGFPGYLWLEKGSHELVFHLPGFRTEVREVRVLEGAVVKLHIRLSEGETTAVEKVSKAAVRRPRPDIAAERGERVEPRAKKQERVVPGRLVLAVSPDDASIYLDGRFLGTSSELARLHAGLLVEQGQHTLEVVRPGYEAERFEFSIESGEEREIEVELSSG